MQLSVNRVAADEMLYWKTVDPEFEWTNALKVDSQIKLVTGRMPSNDKDRLEPCSYKPRNNHGIAATTSSGNLKEGRPPAGCGGNRLVTVSRLEWKCSLGGIYHPTSRLRTQPIPTLEWSSSCSQWLPKICCVF